MIWTPSARVLRAVAPRSADIEVGLDTSVLVRILSGQPREAAAIAFGFLQNCRASADSVFVSDLVLSEAYFALQHHYLLSKQEVFELFTEFFQESGVICLGVATETLEHEGLASAKPGFVDRLIHFGYLAAGADEVATFELAARKLERARVLKIPS